MYTCVYIYIYIHIHMYIYIYIYMIEREIRNCTYISDLGIVVLEPGRESAQALIILSTGY